MPFSSIKEIQHFFAIADDQPDDIRRELRRRLKQLHPDMQPNGSENSATDEVLQLTEALAFLNDAKNRPPVLPAEDITALAKVISTITPDKQKKQLEARLAEHVAKRLSQASRTGRTPKTVLLLFSLICTLLWLFPFITAPHPVLGTLIKAHDPVFISIWIAVLFITAATWLLYRLWHGRETASKSKLQLEIEQNRLFNDFIRSQAQYQSTHEQQRFYKDQFVLYLESIGARWSPFASVLLGRVKPIDPELSQTLADVILLRAETKGIVRQNRAESMRDEYLLLKIPQDV